MTYKDLEKLCEENGFDFDEHDKSDRFGCYIELYEKIYLYDENGESYDYESEFFYCTNYYYDTEEEAIKDAYNFLIDYIRDGVEINGK